MMSEALKNDKKGENGTVKKIQIFFLNFEHWDASKVIF
jgi:hypothetical protein